MLRDKVNELEGKAESMEEYIEELKDCENWYTKERAKVLGQDRIVSELRDIISKSKAEAQEYQALKERYRILVCGNEK